MRENPNVPVADQPIGFYQKASYAKDIPILIFHPFYSILQLSAQTKKDSTLRVGFAGSEPFVMAGDQANGIAPDIWKEIAFNAELDYELQPYASINDGIAAIQWGELDALIGPITINSQRAENISFSQR